MQLKMSPKKKTQIQIRCTVVQKEIITDQASKQGKTISNYLLELAEKDNNLAYPDILQQ